MSFSSDLREELARVNTRGRQERETELAVLLQNLCVFSPLENGGIAVTFSGGNESALKKCFTLILKTVNIDADLCTLFFNGNGEKTAAGGRRAGNLKTQARRECPPQEKSAGDFCGIICTVGWGGGRVVR